MPQYKQLRISGPVFVSQWDDVMDRDDSAAVFLLMGPCSAGKTHFIETLGNAGRRSGIKVSNPALEGCTEAVSCFKVNNVEWVDYEDENDPDPWEIYLIDTPGLSGGNVSVLETIEKLRVWIDTHGNISILRIVYFSSIIDLGTPWRVQRTADTFKELVGLDAAGSISIVTTKWDLVCSEVEQECAEGHFEMLRDHIWEDFVEEDARFIRFTGMQNAAVEVLDRLFDTRPSPIYIFEQMVEKKLRVKYTPFAVHVHRDLVERIERLQYRLLDIEEDRTKVISQDSPDVEIALEKELKEVVSRMECLQIYLDDLGHPPFVAKIPIPYSEFLGY